MIWIHNLKIQKTEKKNSIKKRKRRTKWAEPSIYRARERQIAAQPASSPPLAVKWAPPVRPSIVFKLWPKTTLENYRLICESIRVIKERIQRHPEPFYEPRPPPYFPSASSPNRAPRPPNLLAGLAQCRRRVSAVRRQGEPSPWPRALPFPRRVRARLMTYFPSILCS